jgi:hypothetical protein
MMIDRDLVSNYLQRLQSALGDDHAFIPIFERLNADPAIRQVEAIELASKFVAETAESTSRAKALERVLQRHRTLASFKAKQRAMGGRSAA